MRRMLCWVLGALCLLCAVGLCGMNRIEDKQAGAAAESIVQQLTRVQVVSRSASVCASEEAAESPDALLDPEEYLGVLTIPSLELELPVQQKWSYPRLKKSPCRQYGSRDTEDLVIAAHNYDSHFGRLSRLRVGDSVFLTGTDGVEAGYTVQKVETLDATAVDAVEHSGFALVLYTCTPGGSSRVAVFCDRTD